MILLNWLNAFRHRIRQRRRKQQLPGSRSGLASTPGRAKRLSRLTPQQIELLEERVLLSAVTVTTAADVLDGDTSSISNLLATPGADGFVSLREAVIAANNTAGDDSVLFDAALNGTPILLTISGVAEDASQSGDLDIATNIDFIGNGAGNTIIDGFGLDRVFHLLSGNTSEISGVTIQNGMGGLLNAGGNLTVRNSAILNNVLTDQFDEGGGILQSAGTLTVIASTISNNAALGQFGRGGGISSFGGAGVTVTVLNSTISGNSAGAVGGGIFSDAALTIVNSTITGNRSDADDTGGEAGGGVDGPSSNFVLHNTIVANNFTGTGVTASPASHN